MFKQQIPIHSHMRFAKKEKTGKINRVWWWNSSRGVSRRKLRTGWLAAHAQDVVGGRIFECLTAETPFLFFPPSNFHSLMSLHH